LEHTQPWLELPTENTYGATGIGGATSTNSQIYSTLVTGYQAVACVEVAGGSPFSPQTIVVDRADSGNRLGLRKYVGLKAYEAIKTLKNDWSVTIRSKSTF
jgi:N4-gp56 family major capsid protein